MLIMVGIGVSLFDEALLREGEKGKRELLRVGRGGEGGDRERGEREGERDRLTSVQPY